MFKICSGVSPTLWSKLKSRKLLLNAEKKVELGNLSIFFVKFHDFSFYNIQYKFPFFRRAASGISAWTIQWGCTATHLTIFWGGSHNSFFKSFHKKQKKSHIFSDIFCTYFVIFYELLHPQF